MDSGGAARMGAGFADIWAWRHPRPHRVDGYCIGRTDVALDPRRARRLARRIQRAARLHGLPREVWTSPLRRCADVGRWLKRWGWTHHIDAALLEMDFGRWDGQPWSAIAHAEIEAWNREIAHYAPGGGEAFSALLARAARWAHAARWRGDGVVIVVAHAGWMRARRWLEDSSEAPAQYDALPAAPSYGALWKLKKLDLPPPAPTDGIL